MRPALHPLLLLAALLEVACGSPADRPRCQASTDCPSGSYCASGGVCWPDAVPPTISAAAAACPATPCQRDSLLTVAVRASDDAALAEVTATLDLDPARAVRLAAAAGELRATLALGDWPFPAFERPVQVTVRARDAAGNEATSVVSAGNVTRLKWAVDFAPGELPLPVPAVPAVDSAGVVRFGASNGKLHAIAPDSTALHSPVAVGSVGLTAPVTLDTGGAWVPSDDGFLYRVTGGATPVVAPACDTGGAVKGVALLDTGEVVASSGAGVLVANTVAGCRFSAQYAGAVEQPPSASGSLFFGAEDRRVHAYALNSNSFFVDQWAAPATLSVTPQAQLISAADGSLQALLDLATEGQVVQIGAAGSVGAAFKTGRASASPVILTGGDVVVPEASRTLSRWSAVGDFRWRTATLGGIPQAVLAMSAPGARLVVADSRGGLTCLDDSGSVAWTGQLAPVSVPLRGANLFTPAGSASSLGYFPAPNGKLYAVILDGHLDANAPWPKPFHDPRNSGNATTVIPTP